MLVVLASRDFWYTDYIAVETRLARGNVRVVIASSKPEAEPDPEFPGEPVKPDMLLRDARAADFDALVFCGGKGIEEYLDDSPAAQTS